MQVYDCVPDFERTIGPRRTNKVRKGWGTDYAQS